MIQRTEPAKEAQRILEQSGNTGLPINVVKIIKSFGIELVFTPLPDEVSGILYPEDDNTNRIIVNSDHHENRQRFTMAHELGHYILHKNNKGIHIDRQTFSRNANSRTGLDPIEIEANRFAAELLMPRNLIEEKMEGHEDVLDLQDDIVWNLANMFKVSTAAMSIRLQSQGYLPRSF